MKTTRLKLEAYARYMRWSPTPSESIFRRRLVDAGISHAFQKPMGYFIADFVIARKLLIIELDGDSHDNKKKYDRHRDNCLKQSGWTTIRIPNSECKTWPLSRITDVPDATPDQSRSCEARINWVPRHNPGLYAPRGLTPSGEVKPPRYQSPEHRATRLEERRVARQARRSAATA
jgi:very-short-patch-repair endonuclease